MHGRSSRPTKDKNSLVVAANFDAKIFEQDGYDLAEKIISFLEKLYMPQGAGRCPVQLADYQKKFICDVYRRDKNGVSVVRQAILSIAKKNGKTTLLALLVMAYLFGPLAIPGSQLYSFANARDQARHVFNAIKGLLRVNPIFAKLVRVKDTYSVIFAKGGAGHDSFFKSAAADSTNTHGMDPRLVVYDEIGLAKSDALFHALSSTFGGQKESLLALISTQAPDDKHFFSQLIDAAANTPDEAVVCHVYSQPKELDPFEEKYWHLANPAIGKFRHWEDIRQQARAAKKMRSLQGSFRNYHLNQRVDSTADFVDSNIWRSCAGKPDIPLGQDVFLGLDLSNTTDLSSLAIVTKGSPIHAKVFFWLPGETIAARSSEDFTTNQYEIWRDEGWIEVSKGKTIDTSQIVQKILSLRDEYNVIGMAYDRWRMDYLAKQMQQLGCPLITDRDASRTDKITGLRAISWGQGFKDMSPAVDAFEKAVLDGELVHGNNPVLTNHISNVGLDHDPARNRKPVKKRDNRRIDGAVALMMALGLRDRFSVIDPTPSIYEQHGSLFLN